MARSLELLGLASFNVVVAMTLSAAFLNGTSTDGKVARLTEAGVTAFITQATDMAVGKNGTSDYDITTYFMDHIAEQSAFKTTLRYNIPGAESGERALEMNKMDFISETLRGLKAVTQHETNVQVEYVSVSSDGRTATAVTTSKERGTMPMTMDDGTGEAQMVPVTGISYCEQTLVLGENHMIQMAGATCTTDITVMETM